MKFCNNVSCVSLGRAHWPRAAVAAHWSEGLVRKSSPLNMGCYSNHSNQHKREQGWWPREGCWVEGDQGSGQCDLSFLSSTSDAPSFHRTDGADLPASTLCLCSLMFWWTHDLPSAARGEQPGRSGHTQRQTEDTVNHAHTHTDTHT